MRLHGKSYKMQQIASWAHIALGHYYSFSCFHGPKANFAQIVQVFFITIKLEENKYFLTKNNLLEGHQMRTKDKQKSWRLVPTFVCLDRRTSFKSPWIRGDRFINWFLKTSHIFLASYLTMYTLQGVLYWNISFKLTLTDRTESDLHLV